MNNYPETFDSRAAIEMILYIAQRSKKPTFHEIAKLLYFADLIHLERYGRFLNDDTYIKMEFGPVPSVTYDMLKAVRSGDADRDFPETGNAFTVRDNHTVLPGRKADLDWLSDSEIECLDEAIERYGRMDFSQRSDASHDAAWKSATMNGPIRVEAIVERIGNPDGLLDHLKDPHP